MQNFNPVRLDVKEVNKKGEFTGYAAIFNEEDRGSDIIEPGAFKESLQARPADQVKMLFGHDRTLPIGKWKHMEEDSKGLIATGKILQSVQKGAETLEMMREGIIDSLSIGYQTVKSMYDEKTHVRHLLRVDLWEVSAVVFPMNTSAKITGVKNTDMTKRELEHILRDAGVPNAFAKSVLSGGFDAAKAMPTIQRDADKGTNELKEALKLAIELMET